MNILQWLKDQDYDYTWNVKIGTGTPDIIAFKDKEVAIFEIRKHADEIPSAINQCSSYLKSANKVCVVLSKDEIGKLKGSSLSLMKKHGIGLVQANENFKLIVKPKLFPYYDEKLIEKLKSRSLSEVPTAEKSIDEEIADVLKKHPEGLSITEISKRLGMHRHTVIKYIYKLIGAGRVSQKKVGTVKLCCLEVKR